jgi:hypothetical protein
VISADRAALGFCASRPGGCAPPQFCQLVFVLCGATTRTASDSPRIKGQASDLRGDLVTYQLVFQRRGRERATLHWNGSLDETQRLARTIASEWNADRFLIVEVDGSDAKGDSERLPCQRSSEPPARRGAR